MGDAEEADYQAELSGEDTQLAPSESGTEAHTAWALDDGPEWKPPFWTAGRVTAVVVGVAVVAVVVAAGVAGYHLRGDPVATTTVVPTTAAPTSVSKPPAGWGIPTTKRSTTTPPPPSTVTVTEEAPERTPEYTPVVDMSAFDGDFIRNMKAQGWVIWNEAQSADTGRLVCSMLTNGASFEYYVANHLATVSQARIEEGRAFTSTAMRTYPNCP